MSAPDELLPSRDAIEGAIEFMRNELRFSLPADYRKSAETLIAAARAYLRAPTAPQGAEIAREALETLNHFTRGFAHNHPIRKAYESVAAALSSTPSEQRMMNCGVLYPPTDAETKGT